MDRPRVLIVDDSPTMRQLLTLALKRVKNVDLAEAGDGMDALQKLSADHFDLVLVDINMPVMDGFKLISLVRADDRLKDLTVVVITTEGAKEDREKAIALGANDYVTKPVQPNQVARVVQSLLKLA